MLGHTVVTALDAATALEQAAAERRAAALLDTGLPGIDGYELAWRMRAMPELAAMKLSR